ncbi:MAG: methyltransferase domain-containing protein [Pseudomonadota bacterium]
MSNNTWWQNKGYENADTVGKQSKAKMALITVLDQTENTPCIQNFKQKDYTMMKLNHGDKVLDVGCGLGFDARKFSQFVGPEGHVIGIDISNDFIDHAKKRSDSGQYSNITFQQGDINHLAFKDNTFNAVHAERLFIHLKNPRAALAELIRVTKPGGRIVLADPDFTCIHFSPKASKKIQTAINIIFSQMVANPDICQQFAKLFSEAGLSTESRQDNILRTNYCEWDNLLHLEQMMQAAASQGLITLNEGIAYLKTLKTADKKCQFKGEHPRVTTLGIKSLNYHMK